MATRRGKQPGNPTPRDPALYELQRQMLTQAETAKDLLSEIEGAAAQSERLLNEIRDILSSMASGTAGGGGGAPFFAGAGNAGGYGGGYGGGPNGGRPIMPQNQTQRPGGPGYQTPTGGGYQTGYGRGGMGGMLGYAQASAARLVHNTVGAGHGGVDVYHQNPDGTYTSYKYERNRDGSVKTDANGRPVSSVVETGVTEEARQRRAQVSSVAGRVAGSGNVLDAIHHIPVVGKVAAGVLMPLEATQRFGNFVGNQRAANAAYESIYGPGTSGWDQRVHNFGGRFRNTLANAMSVFGGQGGLSDSDYNQAFQAVSAMGYQGGSRNNMIQFATNNFNQMGMSVGESLQLVATNAKQAATNFSTLTDQLKAVSEMAQQTGQSADVMRQSYIRSYGNAVNSGFGASSGYIAQAQVAATAGQGRMFAGMDTSSMYSSLGHQQVLASTMGYSSVLDFALAASSNPMVMANAQDTRLDQLFMSVVPSEVRSRVEQSIKKNGGAQAVANDPKPARQVVADVEHQRRGSLNVYAISGALQSAGITLPSSLQNDAVGPAIYYVQWVAKQGRTFGAATAAAMAQNDQHTVTSSSQTSYDSAPGGEVTQTRTSAVSGAGDVARTYRANGNSTTGMGLQYGEDAYRLQGNKLAEDPVIGKLEKDKVGYVRVQTSKGPQVVSLHDASRHYRDQLVSGTAVIMSGQNAGATVGSQYGTESNAHYAKTTGNTPTDWETHHPVVSTRAWKAIQGMGLTGTQLDKLVSGAKGKSTDEVIADAKKLAADQSRAAKVTGAITVGLSADAQRLLKITTSGDSLVNTAAAAGAPPALNSYGSSTGN